MDDSESAMNGWDAAPAVNNLKWAWTYWEKRESNWELNEVCYSWAPAANYQKLAGENNSELAGYNWLMADSCSISPQNRRKWTGLNWRMVDSDSSSASHPKLLHS
jgi:hypothetical protein